MFGYWGKEVDLKSIIGLTIDKVIGLEKESDEVRIFTKCGKEFLFYHDQDCCESVQLNDFETGSDDFSGALIVSAEEVVKQDEGDTPEYSESWTWTFYKIETTKGEIWMRWLGESNGYYSESVGFVWVNKPYSYLTS